MAAAWDLSGGRFCLELESGFLGLADEPVGDLGAISSIEVVRAQAAVLHAIPEHGVRGGEHDGHLPTPTTLEAEELRVQAAVAFARTRSHGLHQKGLEPGRSMANPGRAALAGALVRARAAEWDNPIATIGGDCV